MRSAANHKALLLMERMTVLAATDKVCVDRGLRVMDEYELCFKAPRLPQAGRGCRMPAGACTVRR